MDRRAIIGLALAIIAGGAVYFGLRGAPVKAPETATGAAAIADPYVERAQYYDIAANYPTTTPLSAQASKTAVETMQGFIIDTVSRFKSGGPEGISYTNLPSGEKASLQILYLISSSPHTVSYIFTTSEDTGGAHGNSVFTTFTFDTTTGAPLSLADLFVPGADYLGTLSRIAREKLPMIIGSQFANAKVINAGTAPDTKSFKNFFIDNATLDILFDPYAVAAYAAGPQTLQIPLSDLSSILKSEYKP